MTLRDVQGTFFNDAGIISGQNGRYALGLYIEQGLRSSSTTVVANIAARDALYPLVGDQAYVINDGNGEWALFVWNGAAWQRVGNQRSDATDARTLTLDVDLSTANGTQTIGYISSDRTVINVKILVTSAGATDASVTIGTALNTTALLEARDSVLSQTGQYSVDTSFRTSSYTEIVAAVNNPTPGAGQFTIILTYV
jgi:hypothetical protein